MGLQQLQEDEFNTAIAEQQAETARKEREKNLYDSGGHESKDLAVYTALELERLKFIRIMGYPPKFRHKDPLYSPKDVFSSWVRSDKGGRFPCTWPNKDEDPNWILYQIYYLVMERAWDSDNKPYHIHEKLNPELYHRLAKNMLKENEVPHKYESGVYPTRYVVMNVIDREIYDWHKQNKHTVLLSKKGKEFTRKSGESAMNYEPGIPNSIWSEINGNDVAGTYGDFLNYDIAIRKIDTKENPFYAVYHPDDQKKFFNLEKGEENFMKKYPFYNYETCTSKLTDEELSWERYNIEEIYKVTSYRTLMMNLSLFFKKVDATFSTKFFEQLQDLASDEAKNEPKEIESKVTPVREPVNEIPADKPTGTINNPEVVEAEQKPLPTRTVRPRIAEVEKQAIDWDSPAVIEAFKGAPFLKDEEKEMIQSVDVIAKKITYVSSAIESLIDCPECHEGSPNTFETCPNCGVAFV